MADFAAQLPRFEIRADDDLHTNERCRVVPRLDARADLTTFRRAIIKANLQQFVCVGMRLGAEDGGNAKIKFREIIELDVGKWFSSHW